ALSLSTLFPYTTLFRSIDFLFFEDFLEHEIPDNECGCPQQTVPAGCDETQVNYFGTGIPVNVIKDHIAKNTIFFQARKDNRWGEKFRFLRRRPIQNRGRSAAWGQRTPPRPADRNVRFQDAARGRVSI